MMLVNQSKPPAKTPMSVFGIEYMDGQGDKFLCPEVAQFSSLVAESHAAKAGSSNDNRFKVRC